MVYIEQRNQSLQSKISFSLEKSLHFAVFFSQAIKCKVASLYNSFLTHFLKKSRKKKPPKQKKSTLTYFGGCHSDHPPCSRLPVIGHSSPWLAVVARCFRGCCWGFKKGGWGVQIKNLLYWCSFIAVSFRLQIASAVILILINAFPDLFMHMHGGSKGLSGLCRQPAVHFL